MPRGTPPEIVARMTAEMQKAIAMPEIKARREDFGLEVAPSNGPQLAEFVKRETVFWHPLIRQRKLSAE